MKIRTCLAALALGLVTVTADAAQAGSSLLYIGTRPSPQNNGGKQGIYAARLDTRTGKLTSLGQPLEILSVSWITAHPKQPVLFALVNPDGKGTVSSQLYGFRVNRATGALTELGHAATGGLDTTHMAFDARSNTIFGGSFGSGEVTSQEVLRNGAPGSVMSHNRHEGKGPTPRQASPHAHSVAVDPTGRYVVSADMGADKVYVHRFDPKTRHLTPAEPAFEVAPAGTGPRHLVFHPNGRFIYVNTELGASVRVEAWDGKAGTVSLVEEVQAWPAADKTVKSSAEVGIDRSGKHLYLTLRGNQNSIVVYDIDGATGKLTEKQRLATGGRSPRSFGIDPSGRWLVITHDESHTVDVLAIDAKSGELKTTGESIRVPNAGSVVFL